MGKLPLDAKQQIRGYEPLFRSLLTCWLEAYMDATGNTRVTPSDVSAGVAHVFTAISEREFVEGGNDQLSFEEYERGEAKSGSDVLEEIRQMAA